MFYFLLHNIPHQNNALNPMSHLFFSWLWKVTCLSYLVLYHSLPCNYIVKQWLGLKSWIAHLLMFPTHEDSNILGLEELGLLNLWEQLRPEILLWSILKKTVCHTPCKSNIYLCGQGLCLSPWYIHGHCFLNDHINEKTERKSK